ncbi:sce7726 family protein [Pseudomonas triticicola]|uniref:sce7726 family protein n=1 Tax=Pseudomonas triticicola TaxID=2842345 RepID=UPI003EB73DEC
MLREHDIKIALIARLHQKGMLDNAVLINEMVVAKWSRRADLVLANGTLQAFEIKSDFDSLKRLDGQLETFNSRFEKVTVVCAPKFTTEVLSKVSNDTEVLEVSTNNNLISFKVIQRGKTCIIKDKRVLLSFLLKKEIQSLLKHTTPAHSFNLDREALENESLKLPTNAIRAFVLTTLKSRYQETSNQIKEKLANTPALLKNDLNLLSKKKLARSSQSAIIQTASACDLIKPSNIIRLDFSKINKKYGETAAFAPVFAIKRLPSKKNQRQTN